MKLSEHRALRENAGLVEMGEMGVLSIGGRQRQKWLHGMVTQDVRGIGPAEGRYGCAVNLKGKVLSDFQLYVDEVEDRLLLTMDRDTIGPLCTHLDGRIITEDVTLSDLSERYSILALEGPAAAGMLEDPTTDLSRLRLGEVEVLAGRRSHAGSSGFELLVLTDALAAVTKALESRGAHPISRQTLESTRVANGLPRHRIDFDERVIPLEAGLLDAIHWQKGCYLGQEVLARLAHRGHTNKELRLLRVDSELVPPPGASVWPLEDAKKAVGRVTSAAPAPDGDGVNALGYVRRAHFEPGTTLELRWDPEHRASATVTSTRVRGHITLRPENEP